VLGNMAFAQSAGGEHLRVGDRKSDTTVGSHI
jgi:hypothetical protein